MRASRTSAGMGLATGMATGMAVVLAIPSGLAWAAQPDTLATGTAPSPIVDGALIARGGFDRGGNRANNGFSGAGGGLGRGSQTPSGGWSNQVKLPGGAGPTLDRGNWPSQGSGYRGNGSNWSGNGSNWGTNGNRPVHADINRSWNRQVSINNVNLNPGWARPGWGAARPWNTGWYGGWSTPAWGWWGARAAAWGVGTLATAAIINNAVNQSINENTTTILVPNSDYALYYGSVQPSGPSSVTFVVQASGNNYQLSADCNAGTINGEDPKSAAQAELLNAACQIAFGSAT